MQFNLVTKLIYKWNWKEIELRFLNYNWKNIFWNFVNICDIYDYYGIELKYLYMNIKYLSDLNNFLLYIDNNMNVKFDIDFNKIDYTILNTNIYNCENFKLFKKIVRWVNYDIFKLPNIYASYSIVLKNLKNIKYLYYSVDDVFYQQWKWVFYQQWKWESIVSYVNFKYLYEVIGVDKNIIGCFRNKCYLLGDFKILKYFLNCDGKYMLEYCEINQVGKNLCNEYFIKNFDYLYNFFGFLVGNDVRKLLWDSVVEGNVGFVKCLFEIGEVNKDFFEEVLGNMSCCKSVEMIEYLRYGIRLKNADMIVWDRYCNL